MSDLSTLNFDANQVEPTSFDLVPVGDYEAVIVASEMKNTQNGKGQYLSLEIQILNGKYQNRKVFDNLNLVNENDKTVQIAKGTLSAICRAVGILTPKDSSELHNKPMLIKVGIKKASGDYDAKNVVKAYKPRHSGPAPMAPAPMAPVTQSVETSNAPWR